MIQVTALTKSYGDKRGVDNISFRIEKGEILGLLGPNGAGKSTIMKMIAGYLYPDGGTVVVDGFDILEHPKEVSGKIGFLSEIPPLYMDMEVASYLNFICEIRAIPKKERKTHVAEIMELVKISNVKNRIIKNLSKGYRQRVGLAQALVNMPEILILDEPTVGLDPKQITEVRNLVKELSARHTVILSSHILSEISMICEKIIIINQGKIVAKDTVKNLSEGKEGIVRLLLKIKGNENAVRQTLTEEKFGQIIDLTETEGVCTFKIEIDKSEELRIELFHILAENKLPILEMKTLENTLEEAYLRLTALDMEEATKEGAS